MLKTVTQAVSPFHSQPSRILRMKHNPSACHSRGNSAHILSSLQTQEGPQVSWIFSAQSSFGAFTHGGPSAWNSLPCSITLPIRNRKPTPEHLTEHRWPGLRWHEQVSLKKALGDKDGEKDWRMKQHLPESGLLHGCCHHLWTERGPDSGPYPGPAWVGTGGVEAQICFCAGTSTPLVPYRTHYFEPHLATCSLRLGLSLSFFPIIYLSIFYCL